jgi:hypothetical protein
VHTVGQTSSRSRGEVDQPERDFSFFVLTIATTSIEASSKPVYSETDVQEAVCALKNNEFRSICKAAVAFNMPNTTLQGRIFGRTSRATAHEPEQILLPAGENTLA